MNTGLLLRKYGESYTAIVRRLWLTNRGYFKTSCRLEIDLLKDLSERGSVSAAEAIEAILTQAQQYQNVNDANDLELLADLTNSAHSKVMQSKIKVAEPDKYLLKALNIYENKHGQSLSQVFGTLFERTPLRNCTECSKIGFHSNFFNARWMKQCPVHGTPIISRCPTCNHPWPGYKTVRLRKCEDCGSRITYKDLVFRGAFYSFDHEENFKVIDKLFSSRPNGYRDRYVLAELNHDHWQQHHIADHTNSPAYPSFVFNQNKLTRNQRIVISKSKIQRYPLFETSFEFDRNDQLPVREDLIDDHSDSVVEVRERIIQRSEVELLNQEHLDHNFNECRGRYIFDHSGCARCEAYTNVKRGLSKISLSRNRCLFRYYLHDQLKQEVSEPGIIWGIQEKASMHIFPLSISMFLYEAALWTQIRLMYFRLKAANNAERPDRMTLIEWANIHSKITTSIENYAFPFFVTRRGTKGKLYIPEAISSREVNVDNDFKSLMFPEVSSGET